MLTVIVQAVERDVGRGKADWVLHDTDPRDGVPIYLPYCHAIAERPLVKVAIDRAVRASGPNNRRR